MIDRLKANRNPAVLGLAFDGTSVEAVVVRRTHGNAEASSPALITLAADPLSGDPVALGRQLREALDAAGLRPRRCAVALPPSWLFASTLPVPDLPAEDFEGFVELEIERSFPYGPEQLAVARAEWSDPSGAQISLAAVPIEHLERLEQLLRAARLTAVSIAPALPELADLLPAGERTRIDLLAGSQSLGVAVARADGLILHRSIDGVIAREGDTARIVPDVLARELRLTLGQLLPATRQALTVARVLGTGPVADALAAAVQARASHLALSVERADRVSPDRTATPRITPGLPASGALAIAARHLGGRAASFEFLAPRVSAFEQFASRFASGRAAHFGIAAAIAAALVGGAFLVQQIRLSLLRSQWNAIAKSVREVEETQANLRKFRPWFDQSVPSLLVLKTLTEAFPEDGAVTAKTLEVRDGSVVVCSGSARDNPALLRTLDKLRASPAVSDVQVDQLRGKSPIQFSFNFRWDAAAPKP